MIFAAQMVDGSAGFADSNPFFRDGAVHPELVDAEPWRLVTAGFVHLDAGHLLSNLVVLWLAGGLVEAVVSRSQFALLYGASLLGGSLGALILDAGAFSAGASGAIFGLLAGGAIVLRTRGGMSGEFGSPLLLSLLGANLVYTFFKGGVSVGGHVGGALVGAAAGLVMSEYGRAAKLTHAQSTILVFGLCWVVFGLGLLAAR